MSATRSFKVGVLTPGDRDWVYNGLRFATRAAADAYGRDLYSRWTAVREYTVTASPDAANR